MTYANIMLIAPMYGSLVVQVCSERCLTQALELARSCRAGTQITVFGTVLRDGWVARTNGCFIPETVTNAWGES